MPISRLPLRSISICRMSIDQRLPPGMCCTQDLPVDLILVVVPHVDSLSDCRVTNLSHSRAFTYSPTGIFSAYNEEYIVRRLFLSLKKAKTHAAAHDSGWSAKREKRKKAHHHMDEHLRSRKRLLRVRRHLNSHHQETSVFIRRGTKAIRRFDELSQFENIAKVRTIFSSL